MLWLETLALEHQCHAVLGVCHRGAGMRRYLSSMLMHVTRTSWPSWPSWPSNQVGCLRQRQQHWVVAMVVATLSVAWQDIGYCVVGPTWL